MNFIFPPTKILDSLIMMCIIRRGSLHGYALTALIEEKMGWKPSQTAVYNSLKSMEQENLVSSEEKIEKGRVQKIYSITLKGREVFEETHQKMKDNIMKDFSKFISFAQMVSEIEDSDEPKFLLTVQTVRENMISILQLTSSLFREAPEEIQVVLENTVSSLKKIAEKHNIQYNEEEKIKD